MQKKIKIIFIIDSLGPGGTEKQLVLLIQGLKATGRYDISLFLFNQREDEIVYPGVVPEYFEGHGRFSLRVAREFVRLTCRLKEINPDIVQTYFPNPCFWGIIASFLAGVKNRIVTRRDLGFWYSPKELIKARIANLFATQMIVNSQAIKDVIVRKERYQEKKITVIPNGLSRIPTEREIKEHREDIRMGLDIAPKTVVVGVVANFNRPVKRFDLFKNIVDSVVTQSEEVLFMVLGRVPERYREDRVLYLGSVDDPMPYICAFDIALNLSDSEGFSNSVLEYMACGKIVLAADNPGNRELVKNAENGVLLPCGDSVGFSENIFKISERRETFEKAGENAYVMVQKNYLVAHMLSAYQKQYAEIVSSAVSEGVK